MVGISDPDARHSPREMESFEEPPSPTSDSKRTTAEHPPESPWLSLQASNLRAGSGKGVLVPESGEGGRCSRVVRTARGVGAPGTGGGSRRSSSTGGRAGGVGTRSRARAARSSGTFFRATSRCLSRGRSGVPSRVGAVGRSFVSPVRTSLYLGAGTAMFSTNEGVPP